VFPNSSLVIAQNNAIKMSRRIEKANLCHKKLTDPTISPGCSRQSWRRTLSG